ncbi:cadherin-like beta sandwich domain-containing protein [Akkermansiaceae bacterium]|nr:cadherin-like beta sandwich domain-containing protein [Akkermansiaceae bacterium]
MPFRSPFCGVLLSGIALAQSLSAATITADFTSASTVPLTASSYTATGNAVDFSLGFAPARGTSLTLVNLTGIRFISGRFTNLAHGQRVHLRYGTTVYHFIADFYGGDGNDVVLQWAFRSPHAWGGNDSGQLGRGITTISAIPAAVQASGVLAGKIPVAVSAGEGHSLALCSDGTLVAWGLNNAGQLGNRSYINSSVPVAVSTIGAIGSKTVVAVAAGAFHSLALLSDGTVAAWGDNNNGQLGIGSQQSQSNPTAVVTNGALAGKSVVAIAAGDSHSLALCSDGTLVAWGMNWDGQLGIGTTSNGSSVPVTVQAAGFSGRLIRSISAGASHSLAVTTDGRIAVWGSDTSGQLGNGSFGGSSSSPGLLTTLSGANAAICGGVHTLANTSQLSAFAWGNNSDGQLGNSTFASSDFPVSVTTSGALSGKSVSRLAAGRSHSLALCTDGTLTAWGSNIQGQVGNNSSSDRNSPIAISALGTLSGKTPVAIAAGARHSLAIAAENVSLLADDASLVTLTASEGTWFSPFTSGHRDYSITAPTTTSSISFTPRASNPSATVRINGNIVAAGATSPPLPLAFGGNSLSIAVTAADGITVGTYTFFVTRAQPSTDTRLSALTISTGALSPGFSQNAGAYRAELPEQTTSLTLSATTTEPNATVTVNGSALTSGATTPPIPLAFGENRIFIRVTAQDGITIRTTTLIAFRAVPPASQLTALDAAPFILSPGFHPARTAYAIAVPFGTTAISLAPGSLPEGALTVQGAPIAHGETPPPIPLSPGLNIITLRTTSPGGYATDYEIRVVRPTEIDFTFTSANQTAAEFPLFDATGLSARLSLGFSPPAGTSLTVLSLTGISRTAGRFENIAQGQPITLKHGGTAHAFIADYAGGDGNDLVLHPADRQLYTWGTNSWGQLGIGNNTDTATATPVITTGILAGKSVIKATIGGAHTVAHTADGTLAAWGQNSLFQLGTGNNIGRNFPVAVLPQPALSGTTIATASGGSYTLALSLGGTLAAWGNNSNGQFGNGGTSSSSLAVPISTSGVLAGKSITSFSASSSHVLALCQDGTLAAWGANSSGQLGNGTTNTSSTLPVLVDTSGLLRGKTVVQIATDFSRSFALCSDGTLASWGSNTSGELGNGGTTNTTLPTPVVTSGVLAGKSIVQIAAGGGVAYALCSDGTLAGWGYNFFGQIGDGTKINRPEPVLIPSTGALSGKSIAAVLVKSGITLLTCTDGSRVKFSNDTAPTVFETTGIPADRSIVAFDTSGGHTAAIAAAASIPDASEYDLWLNRFPPLTDPSPLADSDADGIGNIIESALGGDPSTNSADILPSAVRNGSQLTFSFHRREDALTESVLSFQFSTDLRAWEEIDLNNPSDPRLTLGPTTPQGLRPVSITLPAPASGSFFSRVKVSRM